MSTVLKKRRLVNSGRRRRLTNKQIRFFGTRRQKAALRNRRRQNTGGGGGRRRRHNQEGIVSQATHAAEQAIQSVERAAEDAIDAVSHQVNRGRRKNVGEILTVLPAANPGSRRRNAKRMAATAKNRGRRGNRGRTANRAHNAGPRRRNRRSNPRVIVRYRNRKANRGHRRRNPDFLSGDAGKVASVLGGALVTSTLVGFLPATLTTGTIGYLTSGVAAVVSGTVLGKVLKNRSLGNWFTVGGLVVVGLQIIQQLMPQLQLPFTTSPTMAGTSGMGLITSSSFYTPQVNLPGSMANFVLPAAIPAPVVVPASSQSGMGQYRSMRRVGRLR